MNNHSRITFYLKIPFVVFVNFIIIISCNKQENEVVVKGEVPRPDLPIATYQYANGRNELATLGRVIFYDKNLSLNNTISCGSCHSQATAFADNHQFSRGLHNSYTSRNSKSILSTSHNLFWDGRAGNFDTAVFMPVMNHIEMNMFNLNILPDKFAALPYYPSLFSAAYGSTQITVSGIREALVAFLKNMYSNTSRFDMANLHAFDTTRIQNSILTTQEIQGFKIFVGKGKCYSCHNSTNLNGYNTLYENIGLDINYTDPGRGTITHNSCDNGLFNVPTLRNIALSAPYMHDGRFSTLRQVIDHYNEGIQNNSNLSYIFRDFGNNQIPLKDTLIQGMVTKALDPSQVKNFPVLRLNLSENEKKSLEAFLKTLTDLNFVTDPRLSNPF